jgi:hypothetical protein
MSNTIFYIQIRPNHWVEANKYTRKIESSIKCIEKYCGILGAKNFHTLSEIESHISDVIKRCESLDDDEYSKFSIAVAHYIGVLITKCLGGSVMETIKIKHEILAYVPTQGTGGNMFMLERITRDMIEYESWSTKHTISCIIMLSDLEMQFIEKSKDVTKSSEEIDDILDEYNESKKDE